MNPFKLIADYLDKAKSHIYGIFAFWVVIFNLQIIFTALFVSQDILYKKTGMLKNEYIRHTYLNIHDWKDWVIEVGGLLLAALLTYLMIWVLPKTLIARAYTRELADQHAREFQKIEKDEDLEKRRQTLAGEQLVTAEKVEEVAKKEEGIEQIEQGQWEKEYRRFDKNGLTRVLPQISEVIYNYKGHLGRYYDNEESMTRDSGISQTDVAIAHSNGLINLDTATNTISLTDKGKYFVSMSFSTNKSAKG